MAQEIVNMAVLGSKECKYGCVQVCSRANVPVADGSSALSVSVRGLPDTPCPVGCARTEIQEKEKKKMRLGRFELPPSPTSAQPRATDGKVRS